MNAKFLNVINVATTLVSFIKITYTVLSILTSNI